MVRGQGVVGFRVGWRPRGWGSRGGWRSRGHGVKG